ncbi:polyamine ABC transporter substrate-binding protein [Mycolicibacterium confluentis]|uniref:ABC transporter substrate-binding protein n=1 Tax=Mycolicibacterium confluentis TaxID=28047 RepID=A0A7I7XTQ6_9MYCO|nr:spermidine/putrescine ABC transporter substrate-binding protein [Mycolicibacterium confluentis]MCV7320957.1 spermidine/putrescine ABC transporter substrate-binding protein [Mycolicibacterium confluentis]ORV27012.1 ABC transporter substrate-binding protein [Mycolicibacterium confluentis]BBZ32639.1 ABC transporter substrate-binding protein [Mycolicibacterium confluentis]
MPVLPGNELPHGNPRSSPSRRQFLLRTALLAAAVPALPLALSACSKDGAGGGGATPSLTIAAPSSPVTWDVPSDNQPIADALAPEKGATLQLYSYADYISPDAVKSFEDKYQAKVQISTFNDTDEAITKIRGGNVDYDIYFPSYDQISRLVNGGLLKPLNHSYIPNISNVWPVFSNPWYDQEWRYTTPYTVYTTGIGWRADQVPEDIGALSNPYDALWDPKYKNKTAIIDDWHTAMALVLLRNGITDVNTSSEADLKLVGEQLSEMVAATSPKVTITMYNDMPAGQIGLAQMWSGDIIQALGYLPEDTSPDVLRYWFPSDGKGLVDNDLMVILKSGKNPVLAHLFLNHMLDPVSAQQNFTQIGYQPPQNSINPDSLVADGFIPEHLKSAIVRPEYFDAGYRLLELDAANDAAWHNVWRAFKAGGA